MKNLVIGALLALTLGAGCYFFLQSSKGSGQRNPPDFGALIGVNRIILVTHELVDQCVHNDDQGIGEGEILFQWAFQFGYGVNVPADWRWLVGGADTGKYTIQLPPLTQLHPLLVQFTDIIEINPANGNRLERMHLAATGAALQRIEAAQWAELGNNQKLTETAATEAAKFFGPLLAEANPDVPIQSVSVSFAVDPENSKTAVIESESCIP